MFAWRVVKECPDIIITFLIVKDFNKRVELEISRYASVSEADSRTKQNIR